MKQFFDSIRPLFRGRLTQRQVDGMKALLDAGRGLPMSHMANVLAQVKRETGGGMYPIKETVFARHKDQDPTDREVIRRLDSAWAKGQLTWVSKPYWREGFFGRGQIQITHESNYATLSPIVGADLVRHPERALELPISAMIAVKGCEIGLFRKARLNDYDGPPFDHYNARDIVNGDKAKRDKGAALTIGQNIAADARAFESALLAAGWGVTPPPVDHVADYTTGPSGFWAGILEIINRLCGGRK